MNGSPISTGIRRLSFLLVLLAAIALAVPALAGQRIEFKNGQVLVVQRVRYEGEIAYLILTDGSEIGFPRALIKEAKAGFQVAHSPFEAVHSGRGPSVSQLRGYKRLLGEAGYPAKVVAKGVLSGKQHKKVSVGFRYRGSIDITEAARGTREIRTLGPRDISNGNGIGRPVPSTEDVAASSHSTRRSSASRLGTPMQIEPRKNARDGLDADPRRRWE